MVGQVKEKQDTWEEKGPSSRRNVGLGLLGLGTQSQGTVQMHYGRISTVALVLPGQVR